MRCVAEIPIVWWMIITISTNCEINCTRISTYLILISDPISLIHAMKLVSKFYVWLVWLWVWVMLKSLQQSFHACNEWLKVPCVNQSLSRCCDMCGSRSSTCLMSVYKRAVCGWLTSNHVIYGSLTHYTVIIRNQWDSNMTLTKQLHTFKNSINNLTSWLGIENVIS